MRLHAQAIVCIALLSPLSCGGCGTEPHLPPQPPPVEIPPSLRTCPAAPTPPATLIDDADLTDFMTDLAVAGQACRDTLAAVMRILSPNP